MERATYIIDQEPDDSVDKSSKVQRQKMWMAVKEIPQTQECLLSCVGTVMLQLGHEFSKGDIACVCEKSGLVMTDRLTRERDRWQRSQVDGEKSYR
jgi:hypothetical protein